VVGAAARTDRSNTCEASGMLAGGFHRPVSINIVDMRQDQTVDLPRSHALDNCGMSFQVVAVARDRDFIPSPARDHFLNPGYDGQKARVPELGYQNSYRVRRLVPKLEAKAFTR
jgi:hypothetical protein